MAHAQLAHHCPLPPAERKLVQVWCRGELSDKEAARALSKSPETIREQRENIGKRLQHTGARHDAAHLLIQLIDTRWLKVAALVLLSLGGPLMESITQTDIPTERTRQSSRQRSRSRSSRRNRRDGRPQLHKLLDQISEQIA
ncbi:MAG: hypothetical protein ACTSY1_02355 [Alphaproteobacteria bacterium]